ITVTENATPGSYTVGPGAGTDLTAAPPLSEDAGGEVTAAGVLGLAINLADGVDRVDLLGSMAADTRLAGALTISATGTLTVNLDTGSGQDGFNVRGVTTINHPGPPTPAVP